MGSEYVSRKHLYDISRSKRTRRPALYVTRVEEEVVALNPPKHSDQDNENDRIQTSEEQKDDHVKLKQFINVDHKSNAEETADRNDKGRAVLGQYLADEKQLQLVVKQPEACPQGVKLKKIVKRYVKALSQMVKSKRNPRLDKPAFRLGL